MLHASTFSSSSSSRSEIITHLDKQEEVWVLGLGGGPVALFDVVVSDVDTHLLWRAKSEMSKQNYRRKRERENHSVSMTLS